jgi:phosphate transport system permease protein
MNGLAFGLTALALLPLLSILWEILHRGLSGFRLEMLFSPLIENGFANAILGTILIQYSRGGNDGNFLSGI